MSYFNFTDNYSDNLLKNNSQLNKMTNIKLNNIEFKKPKNETIISFINKNTLKILNLIPKNVSICPINILYLMVLLTLGASDRSLHELMEGLDIQNLKQLYDQLYLLDEVYNENGINSVKGIFFNNIDVNNNYKELVSKYVIIKNIKFTDTTIESINRWVELETNGMIKNHIQDIVSDMLIVNCMYFKKNWLHKFDPLKTRQDIFYVFNKMKKVNMMYQQNEYNYYEDNENQIIELDYEDKKMSFGIILNKDKNKLDILNKDILMKIDKMDKKRINIYIPKMKIHNKVSLNDIIRRMNINEIFKLNSNSFRKITDNLYVDKIISETQIDITECGTEVSNVNSIVLIRQEFSKEIIMKVDHQYSYYIKDNISGLYIIVGSVMDI